MRKHQTGYIWKVRGKNGATWYGRWYRDEIVDGAVTRVQHCERLCDYSDGYRSKKDVQPLLDEKLKPVNDGTARPESTLPIVEYFDKFFLPHAESEFEKSTTHGYKGLWRMYLKPYLGKVALRDFTCGQAVDFLQRLHRGKGLSRSSLRSCKSLLRLIFSHVRQTDVLSGENPIHGAAIPRKAESAGRTHAYSTGEISAMLNVLNGTAHTAVAMMFFCALRPGEARGLKWTDYEETKRIIYIRRSIWRKEEKGPKTQESIAPVHVPEVLAQLLAELPRSSDFILATPSGKPIDLHNLAAREIVPALTRCAVCGKMQREHEKAAHAFVLDKSLPVWRGFYANRRGISTAIQDVDNALAAKSHLRHSNVATTMAHYTKSLDAAAVRAVDKIDELFQNSRMTGRPN